MYNHFDCFVFLHSKIQNKKLTHELYEILIKFDNLNFIKYIHGYGVALPDKICSRAVRHNSLKCLKYFNDHVPNTNILKWQSDERNHSIVLNKKLSACMIAIQHNYYDAFVFAHENGCLLDSNTVLFAVKYNNLKLLDYIWGNSNASINPSLYQYCTDYPKMFKYLYDKLQVWPPKFLKTIIENYNPHLKKECLKCFYFYLVNGGTFCDVQFTVINLQYYEKHGLYIGSASDINNAAKVGCTEMVKHLHELDFDYNIDIMTFYFAIESGNIECLKYLHKQNTDSNKSNDQLMREFQQSNVFTVYKLPAKLLECAVRNDKLEIVKYLYDNGCPLTQHAFEIAVKRKNKEIISYLHKRNCPIKQNLLDVLKIKTFIDSNKIPRAYYSSFSEELYLSNLRFYDFLIAL